MLIDLIGQNVEILMAENHIGQSLQFLLAVYATCRVAGRAEDEHTGLGGDSCFELGGCHLEILFETGFHDDWLTTCQQYHLGIAHPVRGRDDDFLAFIDQSHHGVADTLLGTVGYQYLVDAIVELVLVLQLGHDGFAKIGIAWYG